MSRLNQLLEFATCFIPVEWGTAALLLALLCTWVVIGLFAYLNHFTRKHYFRLWLVSWMFYAAWLASCLGLTELNTMPLLVMLKKSCIGLSALFMFWGSYQ